jgi:hypothetical protein
MFVSGAFSGRSELLTEDDKPLEESEDDQYLDRLSKVNEKDSGGWLDDDDIED